VHAERNAPAARGTAWPSLSNIDCRRRVEEARGEARRCPASPLTRLAPRQGIRVDGRYAQSRLQYNETDYNTYNNTAKIR